jgi:hypothetical protein
MAIQVCNQLTPTANAYHEKRAFQNQLIPRWRYVDELADLYYRFWLPIPLSAWCLNYNAEHEKRSVQLSALAQIYQTPAPQPSVRPPYLFTAIDGPHDIRNLPS